MSYERRTVQIGRRHASQGSDGIFERSQSNERGLETPNSRYTCICIVVEDRARLAMNIKRDFVLYEYERLRQWDFIIFVHDSFFPAVLLAMQIAILGTSVGPWSSLILYSRDFSLYLG